MHPHALSEDMAAATEARSVMQVVTMCSPGYLEYAEYARAF